MTQPHSNIKTFINLQSGNIRRIEWDNICKAEIPVLMLLLSHSVVSDSLPPHRLQHANLPCPSPSPGACSNSCPLSWWCHPTISSCHPLLLLSIFPRIKVFSNELALRIKWPNIGALASTSVLPMSIQDWFPLGWTGLISCWPRDSQESSPTPQFKSINSLVLSLLYVPTLIFVHNYWKNHSFDCKDLCWQSNVTAF